MILFHAASWCNVAKILLIFNYLMFLSVQALAQTFLLPLRSPQPNIIWDDDSLAIFDWTGSKAWIYDIKTGHITKYFSMPSSLGATIYQGKISKLILKNDRFIYAQQIDEATWNEAELDSSGEEIQGVPYLLYETGKHNLLFGMNTSSGFIMGKEASCCAWWRRTPSGRIKPQDIIPIELDVPAYLPSRLNDKLSIAQNTPFRRLHPILDYPIRVPGAFLVVSWKTGIIWVIKEGITFPTRTIDVGRIDPDCMKGKKVFPPVILGIQPMRNGNVLIAKRTSMAIAETDNLIKTIQKQQTLKKEKESYKQKVNTKDDSQAVRVEAELDVPIHPDFLKIEWIELDPATGKLSDPEETLISKAPTHLKSMKAAFSFNFAFDTRGKLICPWTQPRNPDPGPDSSKANESISSTK